MLQAWQSEVDPPPQPELQHTPSTQKPLWHWAPVEQGLPLISLFTVSAPHQVPQRSNPLRGLSAYSWIVHMSTSFTGSSTVAL